LHAALWDKDLASSTMTVEVDDAKEQKQLNVTHHKWGETPQQLMSTIPIN